MVDIFDVGIIKTKMLIEWDVFCQELEQNDQVLEDLEEPYLHAADLSSGARGKYTFADAYELLEENKVDLEDIHGPNYWQDEWFDKWNEEVKDTFGTDYFIDWFSTDGSICIFYKPGWDDDFVSDDFAGSWAWSKGISPDMNMSEANLREYLIEVEETLRREFLLS